jgi:hypothetical protein
MRWLFGFYLCSMLRYLLLGWLLLATASAWAIKPLATY